MALTMARRCLAAMVLFITSALLVACGGGSGGDASSSSGVPNAGADLSTKQYLPLQTGSRWVYQDSDSDGTPLIHEITGTRSVSGSIGAVLSSTDPSEGESVLVETASGISQLPGLGADPLTIAVGPLQLMKYPMRVGDSFTAAKVTLGTVVDFDGDGRADSAALDASTQVVALEALDTAVGRFSDALHLRTTATITVQSTLLGRSVTIVGVTDDWFAAGVGLVRSTTRVSSDGLMVSTATQTITGYKVKGQSNDTAAPTAAAGADLGGNSPLGPLTPLTLSFSEAMDTRTLAGAFQVLDGGGHSVAGSVSTTSTGLTFTPTSGWASGSYTAVLANSATDLVGNALATTQRWPFSVDATAPSLLQSSPVDGAVDVATASALQLQFSEPLDPATVNAQTISIGGLYAASLSYQVSGSVVTLVPSQPLRRGTAYKVYVNGVKDLSGNAIVPTSFSFVTDPGRFGAAVKLPTAAGDWGQSGAATFGDLNGDGRIDVATGLQRYDSALLGWAYGIQIVLQQADGSMALGAQMPMPAGCSIGAMRVADLDGDGRNELIVGGGSCGVKIFRRDSGGAWAVSSSIAAAVSARLEVADLNGDGRPDLVAFGNDGQQGKLQVWLNLPGGWSLLDQQTFGDASIVVADLLVGDLDGDGRPDIVFSGARLSGDIRNSAGLLLQASDGHFSAPQWLTAGNGSARGMALGDFNGDGRRDIAMFSGYGPIFLYLQGADGSLNAAASTLATSTVGAFSLKAVDLDGDGLSDLVYDSGGNLSVRLQKTDGAFSDEISYPHEFLFLGNLPSDVLVGDLNADGRPDVLINRSTLLIQRPVPVGAQALRGARTVATAGLLGTIRRWLSGPDQGVRSR